MYDCPEKEDEEDCSTCPGLYRCLSSQVCLLDIHLCDGFGHCPHRDDELLCNVTCPDHCTCHGLAFMCIGGFFDDVYTYPDLRCLEVHRWGGGNGTVEGRLRENALLIHLSVTDSGLTHFINISLPSLNSLDLRDNNIVCLCHVDFKGLERLRILILRNNPLSSAVSHWPTSSSANRPLSVLDLTNSRISHLNLSHFSVFPHLHTLNMSGCSTQRITGAVSQFLGELGVLDLRGCPVSDFPPYVFRKLHKLQALFSSTYRLCCEDLLPEAFNSRNCLAPSDSLSDCDRLLKDDVHITFTAIVAALAVVGNVAGGVARLVRSRTRDTAFRALMLHLCVSDGVMGVYLTVISVADRVFQGQYLWWDIPWRRSDTCYLSSFLSVLSSQVSAVIVCLLMLDSVATHSVRMERIRFLPRSVHLLSAANWITGVTVGFPIIFDMKSGSSEASQHALCTPMLVPSSSDVSPVFRGYITFNCVVHVLTTAGAVYIACKSVIHSDVLDPVSTIKASAGDAKRLTQTYIATSKVLCWFIVSLPATANMGRVTLPEEVPVNIAVIVLPLNAALNPLLSVLAVVLTHRRQAQKARLMKILTSRIAAKSSL